MRRRNVTKSRFGAMLLLVLTVFASLAVTTGRAGAASPEAAPAHAALNDRFSLQLGGFYFQTSTQASLAPSTGGVGVIIDFENTLGLEERNWGGLGGFLWRMSERWRLEVEYFELNRSASRTLSKQIEWGDQVYPIGTTVNSSFDFSDARIGVGYSFFKRPDKELGAGVGLHVTSIKTSLEGAGVGTESSDVLAPLPVLSLYGGVALTKEWAVRFRADWLSLSYGNYSGALRSTALDVLYHPFRNVGFGLGQRTLVLDIEISETSWHGKARSTFTGPTAFMTISF
jgi:hypothetical protein